MMTQIGETYLGISRCSGEAGYTCKIEYHELREPTVQTLPGGSSAFHRSVVPKLPQTATPEGTLMYSMRTPSHLTDLAAQWKPEPLLLTVFDGAAVGQDESVRASLGDTEDRGFLFRMPIVRTLPGVVTHNST